MTETADSNSVQGSEEVDVEQLQAQLDQIQTAMGLDERYPTFFHLWLVYAVLVLLASVASQVVVTYELSMWLFAGAWFFFMSLGGVYERVVLDYESNTDRATTPDDRIQLGSVVFYLFAVLAVTLPYLDADGVARTSVLFALIVGATGAVYILQANAWKARYVRTRDRYAFYAGGVWMLVYAVLVANVSFLQEWGYVIYGVLFALHGVGSYLYLSKS